jgi:hypothetical protein
VVVVAMLFVAGCYYPSENTRADLDSFPTTAERIQRRERRLAAWEDPALARRMILRLSS